MFESQKRAKLDDAVNELPRVLFCCFDVIPGPHARSRRLNEYLKAVGSRFQVVVLSNKTADLSHIEKLHGARHMRVPVGTGDVASQAKTFERAVRRQLESEEYDIVHFFDPFSGAIAAELKSDAGYTLIYDACAFYSDELPVDHQQVDRLVARARRLELLCLMSADAVIVASREARDRAHALGVALERVLVLRAPVDRAAYPDQPPPTTGSPLQLLHLGDSAAWQEVDVLLEALSLVPRAHQIRLTVVIDKSGPQARSLLEHAQRLQVADRVELREPVLADELHKVVCSADVGLITLADIERNHHGPALARLGEFFAAGRPIIAADLPIVRELVPLEAGPRYRPGDARSLADAIVALETSAELRARSSQASFVAAAEVDALTIRAQLTSHYALWLGLTDAVDGVVTTGETTQLQGPMSESTQVARLDDVFANRASHTDLSAVAMKDDVGTNPHALMEPPVPPYLPGARETAPPPVTVEAPAPQFSAPVPRAPADDFDAGRDDEPKTVGMAPVVELPLATVPLVTRTRSSEQPMPITPDDDVAEIGADEVIALGEGDGEPEEVLDADALDGELGGGPQPIASALDPWLAQAAHGYCPPEATVFVRHTPPTTMPGKDPVGR